MKLLKKDHYTITRLLLEDSDGKLYELEVDSPGNYRISPWDGEPDGSLIDDLGKKMPWEEYSKGLFEGEVIPSSLAEALSEDEQQEDIDLILPPDLVSEIKKIATAEHRSFDQEINHLVDLGIKVVEAGEEAVKV